MNFLLYSMLFLSCQALTAMHSLQEQIKWDNETYVKFTLACSQLFESAEDITMVENLFEHLEITENREQLREMAMAAAHKHRSVITLRAVSEYMKYTNACLRVCAAVKAWEEHNRI